MNVLRIKFSKYLPSIRNRIHVCSRNRQPHVHGIYFRRKTSNQLCSVKILLCSLIQKASSTGWSGSAAVISLLLLPPSPDTLSTSTFIIYYLLRRNFQTISFVFSDVVSIRSAWLVDIKNG